MVKRITVLIFSVCIIICSTANVFCIKSKATNNNIVNSQKAITAYYNYVKAKQYDKSYFLLTNATKKVMPKQRYIEVYNLEDVESKTIDIKVNLKPVSVANNKITYSVAYKFFDNLGDKTCSLTFHETLLLENGSWKIDNTKELNRFTNKLMAQLYAGAGYVLANGKHQPINYDKAISYMQKSIQLNPSVANTYLTLGYAYFDSKKYDRGIIALQKGYEKSTNINDKSEALANMAACYFCTSDFINAREYSNKALEMNMDNRVANSVADALDNNAEMIAEYEDSKKNGKPIKLHFNIDIQNLTFIITK